MHGIIIDAPVAHRRKLKVNPICRDYGEKDEPYCKYSCPVCDAAGNARISIPYGTPSCPLCGVNLNWERAAIIGDNAVITTDLNAMYPDDGMKGTVCSIIDICTVNTGHGPSCAYRMQSKENPKEPPFLCRREEFTILVNPDEAEETRNEDVMLDLSGSVREPK